MIISKYDDNWPKDFELIRKELSANLTSFIAIHHVGSTSIPGMFAKPIIDIDIEMSDYNIFNIIKDELQSIGYTHCGNQEIEEREVFKRNNKIFNKTLDSINHHLYVCPSTSKELERHIIFRDYLRSHQNMRDEYTEIKKEIINKYGEDNKTKYVEVKENEYRWFFDKVIQLSINEHKEGRHPTMAST